MCDGIMLYFNLFVCFFIAFKLHVRHFKSTIIRPLEPKKV